MCSPRCVARASDTELWERFERQLRSAGYCRQPVRLRGQIDGRDIQLSLQPKKNEDGLEGRYFFFGGSPEILVAGEVDGDDLLMEESVNGKDVSGQWEGHRQGQSITGTWSSADGSISKPFALQLP